ncbi:MAG: hypothetical protein JJE17_05170 [Peptostreptococcaceae bacterium]|nr:hypothetical protein [Peptostreptococcaceae bacterium]
MKKQILYLFLAFPFGVFGQALVSDPVLEGYAAAEAAARSTTTANTVKQLGEAYKQTTELSKTATFLKQSYEQLHEINVFITNLSRLDRLIKKQESLITTTKDIVTDLELSKLYTLEEVNALHHSFLRMIATTNDIVEMLDIILKPKTSMTDGERMMLLRQMEEDFNEKQCLMDKTIWEYRRVRNQRIFQNEIKRMHKL